MKEKEKSENDSRTRDNTTIGLVTKEDNIRFSGGDRTQNSFFRTRITNNTNNTENINAFVKKRAISREQNFNRDQNNHKKNDIENRMNKTADGFNFKHNENEANKINPREVKTVQGWRKNINKVSGGMSSSVNTNMRIRNNTVHFRN